MHIYKPSEFAKKIGVSLKTLQRWDKQGMFKAHRTPTNRRYYTQAQYNLYMSKHEHTNIDFKKTAQNLLKQTSQQFALIQMDINGFKTLNHIYGETICDEILIHIETILSKFIEGKGVLYRFADIFTMIYPFDTFEALTDEIKNMIDDLSDYDEIKYRTSWGVYIIENNNDDEIWAMFDKVSIARQSIKNIAISNISLYTPSQQDAVDKINIIENKMQSALDNNEFALYLQPKYDITTKKIIGAEGLIRWIESDGSIMLPKEFIPVFEQNGFVIHTDRFIWEKTCETLSDWKSRNIPLIPISINASRQNINDDNFVNFLIELTEKYDIDKKYLEIEITESMDIKIDNEVITELRNNGFLILMDDFGAKYSSINTLCNTDFDIIKLDKKIIKNIDSNKNQIIAEKMIDMIKAIDLDVIAEGVENNKQVTFLKENGCINVQGFLYAKPMPVPDFEKILLSDMNIVNGEVADE